MAEITTFVAPHFHDLTVLTHFTILDKSDKYMHICYGANSPMKNIRGKRKEGLPGHNSPEPISTF